MVYHFNSKYYAKIMLMPAKDKDVLRGLWAYGGRGRTVTPLAGGLGWGLLKIGGTVAYVNFLEKFSEKNRTPPPLYDIPPFPKKNSRKNFSKK